MREGKLIGRRQFKSDIFFKSASTGKLANPQHTRSSSLTFKSEVFNQVIEFKTDQPRNGVLYSTQKYNERSTAFDGIIEQARTCENVMPLGTIQNDRSKTGSVPAGVSCGGLGKPHAQRKHLRTRKDENLWKPTQSKSQPRHPLKKADVNRNELFGTFVTPIPKATPTTPFIPKFKENLTARDRQNVEFHGDTDRCSTDRISKPELEEPTPGPCPASARKYDYLDSAIFGKYKKNIEAQVKPIKDSELRQSLFKTTDVQSVGVRKIRKMDAKALAQKEMRSKALPLGKKYKEAAQPPKFDPGWDLQARRKDQRFSDIFFTTTSAGQSPRQEGDLIPSDTNWTAPGRRFASQPGSMTSREISMHSQIGSIATRNGSMTISPDGSPNWRDGSQTAREAFNSLTARERMRATYDGSLTERNGSPDRYNILNQIQSRNQRSSSAPHIISGSTEDQSCHNRGKYLEPYVDPQQVTYELKNLDVNSTEKDIRQMSRCVNIADIRLDIDKINGIGKGTGEMTIQTKDPIAVQQFQIGLVDAGIDFKVKKSGETKNHTYCDTALSSVWDPRYVRQKNDENVKTGYSAKVAEQQSSSVLWGKRKQYKHPQDKDVKKVDKSDRARVQAKEDWIAMKKKFTRPQFRPKFEPVLRRTKKS